MTEKRRQFIPDTLHETWHDRAERLRREFREAIEKDRVDGPLIAGVFTAKFLIGLLVSTSLSIGSSLIARAFQKPVTRQQGSLAGQEIRLTKAEQGTFEAEVYGGPPETDAETLEASTHYDLNTKVVPEEANGYYYRISAAGTTGATLPALPTVKGVTVSSGTVTIRCEGRTGGGVKLGPVVIWTPPQPIEKHVTKEKSSGGGKAGGGPKVTTETTSYSISLAMLWARGPIEYFRLLANADTIYQTYTPGPTGVPDPTVPPDDPFDPDSPPDPNTPWTRPTARYSGALTPDVGDSLVGTVLHGGNAGLALYEGNTTQLPDSVIEADVDGRYGAGSTPAYWNRGYSRLSNFHLDRWQGAVPLFNGVIGNKTRKTLMAVCAHLSDRTGVLTSSDYNYTAFAAVDVRGFVIGQRYQPAEVMQRQLAIPFNAYFVETDKIYGRLRGGAVSASITDEELGWVNADSEGDETPISEIDSELATETEIPRRFDFKFIDIEKDFEQNTQGDSRQVTSSEHVETLEIPLTLYAEEAREVTQRELYRRQIEAETEEFALDWSYLWLEPGMSVEVERDEGFTHRIFIKTFKPCIGINEGTGVAEDVVVFDQTAVTSGGTIIPAPVVPIPAMSITGFYDEGALRTQDEGKPGFYAYVVKRTGDGDWSSAALFKETPDLPLHIVTLTKEATLGVALTKLGAWTDTSQEDSTRTFTANAGTDTLAATAHELENDETVMLSNVGGALPGGLSASTLYHVVNRTANALQLSLTSGGSVVDITSAGTGTHSVQRVVDVDLYGTEATLETVTTDQIELGDNAFLWGNEVVQPRTWEQVAGFPNRWRGRNFTRARVNTDTAVGTHVAGERVLLLDDAVQFIEQDIAALNVLHTYRAVTSGQSYDDAAQVDFTFTGGALKYPAVSIQGTKDSNGDWRFLLFGTETRDPEGERYKFEIDGSPRAPYILRGAASRPVSLSLTSALPSDMVPPPGKGQKQYREATVPGNSVTNSAAFLIQMVSRERSAVSFTYSTTLDETDSPVSNQTSVTFSPGATYELVLMIEAETADDPAVLTVTDSNGLAFTDSDGEATDTRYTVEFRDGKVSFYRDRHVQGNPFYVHTLPSDLEDPLFPMECRVSAGTQCSLSEIEIDDEGAALLYTESEQIQDFGSAQASITVRACQQRVVGGVVVDGVVTEVEFP